MTFLVDSYELVCCLCQCLFSRYSVPNMLLYSCVLFHPYSPAPLGKRCRELSLLSLLCICDIH